ncbi:MAG: PAS domain-containing sensor histidine kinase [Alphaproteobacteria bacterium]|nr:PAS domain-containing sensor histidine kinase [Alphaproteobacteria bacterium]
MTGSETEIPPEQHRPSALSRLLDALVPLRRSYRKQVRENQRLESFLRAVPVEYCGWDQAGVQAISPGFCNLLGIANVNGLADIQSVLGPGDAAALESLFDQLEQHGETFELNVQTTAGGKMLKISGKQGAADAQAPIFSVIWIADITPFAQKSLHDMESVAAAEKRENDLRAAINGLPFPVWLRNQALDLVWCNKSYSRLVDDTAAAVIADQKELPLTGGGKADMGQRVLAQRALAKLAPQTLRGHVIIDKQRRLVEMTEAPVDAGKQVIGVALDVTREEEWESSCKRLAGSHHAAMEQLRTAIAMFDTETRLEFYNSAYEQLTGMSGAWLDTKPRLVDIIDKMRELRKLPEQADYKLFKQNWVKKFTTLLDPSEEMLYLPDGSVIRMIVVPRAAGGAMLTLEDVTSHLKLETSYNTLMAVQQETMDNLAEGVVVFGEDGRVRLSNNSFAKMWGIPPEDLTGALHISKLVERTKSFFDAHGWPAMRQTLLGNGLEREPRRGRIERNNGSVLEYSVMPLPDGNILNAYFDITDTVKVEQALLEKNAALQAAERLKTDFLANMSYQLRTPLNAIMGFAEMLQQQYFGHLNERQMEYTGSMIEAGQRLISLVNDILDLSTIEAGYFSLYPVEINVHDLLERVVHLTREWAHKQNLEMVIHCPDARLTVMADERRLKQVLLNLISNAINYSPNGGKITLIAEKSGDTVSIGVKDTGMGIPEEDMASVFTPFERINSKKAHRRSGAGLGLTLVKNIVELHGGTAVLESKEGIGTLVTCRLPAGGPNAALKGSAISEKKNAI